MYELIIWFILTILFLIYIQFSPDMGNIWIRSGRFMPIGAIKLIFYPFKVFYNKLRKKKIEAKDK